MTTCERCDEPADADASLVVLVGPLREHRPSVRLCTACARDFRAWANRMPKPPEAVPPPWLREPVEIA